MINPSAKIAIAPFDTSVVSSFCFDAASKPVNHEQPAEGDHDIASMWRLISGESVCDTYLHQHI